MTTQIMPNRQAYYIESRRRRLYDPELEPYMSLFQKPLTKKKCRFTKQELEIMCRDPLHSPRLILYLIDCIKAM